MSTARSPLADGAVLRRVVQAGDAAEPIVGALERQAALLERLVEMISTVNLRVDLLVERAGAPTNGAGHG